MQPVLGTYPNSFGELFIYLYMYKRSTFSKSVHSQQSRRGENLGLAALRLTTLRKSFRVTALLVHSCSASSKACLI